MNDESSGSWRTTASASRRMRVHTGSTLSSTLTDLVCCWLMIASRPRGPARPGMSGDGILPHIGASPDPRNSPDPSKIVAKPSQTLKEFEDGSGKLVVIVARHHVAG